MQLSVKTFGASTERAARKDARAEIENQTAARGIRTKGRINYDCSEPVPGFWNCTAVVNVEAGRL